MHIVFLDASTLHSGELDLSPLQRHGTLTTYPVTPPDQVAQRIHDADIVITNKALMSAETIAHAPKLKLIVSCATGVNQIDLDAAKSHQVVVSNVAGYSTPSVAQHVFTFILNFATQIPQFNAESRNWPNFPTFTSLAHPCFDLSGKTLGIAGLGEIGAATAKIAQSFGMHVQVLAREGSSNQTLPELPRLEHALFFSSSDFVSLHCPLTPATEGMINKESLSLMKPTAFLVNTGRGPLIHEADLAEALNSGQIAGAGLDVLSTEPPAADNPLILCKHPQLSITPHTAWSTIEARTRLLAGVTKNIDSFVAGSPNNRIV
ncbi:D-2-hydroxyacid dehydrogenase [Rubritalea tangerina]|uniref:D-2-hydroxyacid dehydrogenase n=2 Tax=Rubritalea tangerina TaxID=430798 RepID=A0ABW4ZBI6_9BACT